jgi:PIN domain nuclease of toxin-antitoxin system
MIVMDTCAIIWNALQPEMMSAKAAAAVKYANSTTGMYICDISFWEISMLIKKGRINPGCDYLTFMDIVLNAHKYVVAQITPTIAELANYLPPTINKDPADRIIAATAISYHAPLVTGDSNLNNSPLIPSIW